MIIKKKIFSLSTIYVLYKIKIKILKNIFVYQNKIKKILFFVFFSFDYIVEFIMIIKNIYSNLEHIYFKLVQIYKIKNFDSPFSL